MKIRIKFPTGYLQPGTPWLEPDASKAYLWSSAVGKRMAKSMGAEIEEVQEKGDRS